MTHTHTLIATREAWTLNSTEIRDVILFRCETCDYSDVDVVNYRRKIKK